MANRDELKQQMDADARVALLGLAANRQGAQQGRCLSSQEMAELVDGKCESDRRQLHLKHLSTCETCYSEWLDLQQELSQACLKQKKPLLFQRRVLTFSGSLLAAAASVVFYLNLLDTSPKSEESLILTVPQFEKEQSLNVIDIPVQQKSVESFSKPVPVTQSKLQFDEVQTESVQERVKKGLVKPSGQVPIRTKNMAASAMALDPIQQWIQQVQKKCAEESSGTVVWQDLILQGKDLSSRETFSKFESILEKLNQLIAGESQKPVCIEIQQILKEKNDEQ